MAQAHVRFSSAEKLLTAEIAEEIPRRSQRNAHCLGSSQRPRRPFSADSAVKDFLSEQSLIMEATPRFRE
jgi:hypothetical protein